MKHTLLTLLLLLVAFPLWAGDGFTRLDWDALRSDSLLPVYREVVPLESDYRAYDYRVQVLFPEWGNLSASELAVVQRFADEVADTLRIETHVGVSRKVGMLDIAFCPVVRHGNVYRKLLSAKIVISPVAKKKSVRRMAAVKSAERYTRQSKLSTGRWVKISVSQDGIYSLGRSALIRMGFSNPDKVHLYGYGGYRLSEVSNPADEFDDLQEVPFYKRGSDFLFWANGLVYWEGNTRVFNPYANAGCYFLTEEADDNTAATEAAYAGETQMTFTSQTLHTLYEKDDYAYYHGGRNLYDAVDFASSNTRSYTLHTPGYVSDARLTVVFSAAASSTTELSVRVNGTDLSGTLRLGALGEYVRGVSGQRIYDVSGLADGDNWNVRLASTPGNEAHLDYLALHYTSKLVPQNGWVAFGGRNASPAAFELVGSDLVAMRIPSPQRAGAIVQGTQQGGVFRLNVDDASERYVAFDHGKQYPTPTVVGHIENQNLHALEAVDMVIIIPESGKLLSQAQRLADAHSQYDGLRVAVVRADQIYNEFSSGTPDATAYRRLMKMLYDRAKSDADAPKYLLLFGDAAWDNRMLTASWRRNDQRDYLLAFESENSLSDINSYVMEDYFGLLDDGEGRQLTRDKVDLGIGRFPVTTESEAKIMVDKSIAHLTNQYAGNWKNVVSFIGDDGDENLHLDMADNVANRVRAAYPEMEVRKLMADIYPRVATGTHNSYPAVRQIIEQQMKEGALVVNYTGHASAQLMSHEQLVTLADMHAFKGNNLPLWVAAACDVLPFDGLQDNLGEAAVLNGNGTAVAFFSAARTVYARYNLPVNQWFMHYLFATDAQGRRNTVGDAHRLAKVAAIDYDTSVNKLHYALLGDPALRFGAPTNRVVLDSINGKAVGGNIQLKAGAEVRMSGHVSDAEGTILSDMNGVLSARVYDSEAQITCLNNAKSDTAFVFTNRDKVLYYGQDSLRQGRFQLKFVLPKDINYSNQSGRVVFYAISNDRSVEANGYNEQFTIGEQGELTDTVGPNIFMYLNAEGFEDGGRVNATPCFLAQLSDSSGINYFGNGLGHNLQLCIDDNPATTYVLDDYYQSEFGDYTKGSVMFSIPTLADGSHTLRFRAWDVLNNTSSQTLNFVVDSSLSPNLVSVQATQNPAVTSTIFLVAHDREGSAVNVRLEVFDFSGQRMFVHEEATPSAPNLIRIPWNLSNNSGGRLGTGIYLYRVTLRCQDSEEVSRTQKIILTGNK